VRRLVRVAKAGDWPANQALGGLTLTFEDRHRRRLRLSTDQGEAVLLDLAQPAALAEGDGLACENGGWLSIHAAAEDVLDVAADDPRHLARLAWHLGNRHMPTEVLVDGRLRIAYDHVIEAMLQGLDARIERKSAPFQPEGGAYAGHHHASSP
jgi:urease accessory protein